MKEKKMSVENQIEEMTRDILEIPPLVVKFNGRAQGKRYLTAEYIAKHLHYIGWRKQSEGEWIKEEPWNVRECVTWRCSVCKETFRDKTKYCPNCGAKMKGGAG